MSVGRKEIAAASISLAVAGTSYIVVPSGWSAPARVLTSAAILLGMYGLLAGLPVVTVWIVRRTAVATVRFLVYALRQWAEQHRGVIGKDTIWNWLTDQLLVAQGRYAFSVSCIAFEQDQDGSLHCLLLKRRFESFGDSQIWMWPGGRFRGSIGSIEKELQQLVHDETGCNVELLPLTATLIRSGGFSEIIETYNHETGRSDLRNELVGSPLIVMQQNRPQRYEVPGHIDLIYLARVRSGQTVGDATLLSVADLDRINERQLWLDTKECIKRAAVEFRAVIAQTGRSALEQH